MERKIGEIFECNSDWFQCVEGRCIECYFSKKRYICKQFLTKKFRTSSIIFKKLEKVGEPIVKAKRHKGQKYNSIIPYAEFQKYKVYTTPILPKEPFTDYDKDNEIVYIEIKQNKEDMEESIKNDIADDKIRMDLLPWAELEEIAKVYTAGAKKYGANKWQNLPNGYERYKSALLRHLCEVEKGNDVDVETGCLHCAQVAWNAIAMLHFKLKERQTEYDEFVRNPIDSSASPLQSKLRDGGI